MLAAEMLDEMLTAELGLDGGLGAGLESRTARASSTTPIVAGLASLGMSTTNTLGTSTTKEVGLDEPPSPLDEAVFGWHLHGDGSYSTASVPTGLWRLASATSCDRILSRSVNAREAAKRFASRAAGSRSGALRGRDTKPFATMVWCHQGSDGAEGRPTPASMTGSAEVGAVVPRLLMVSLAAVVSAGAFSKAVVSVLSGLGVTRSTAVGSEMTKLGDDSEMTGFAGFAAAGSAEVGSEMTKLGDD